MSDKELQAYSHYQRFCQNLGIKPASSDTYLKETNTLNKAPMQTPQRSYGHRTETYDA